MLRWFPWRFFIKHAARRHRFLDPFRIIARVRNLAQPSEVAAPLELVRAGFAFHARGFVNSQAVQHNLDWVWPYWIECQYDPRNNAFIPRAFSITHTNMTHRNWTALGLPDSDELPIVDPRGLLTPFFDSWSLDAWFIPYDGEPLIPSRQPSVRQKILFDPYSILTTCESDNTRITTLARVGKQGNTHCCSIRVEGYSEKEGDLVVALRPYNPEGISFIDSVELSRQRQQLTVNSDCRLLLNQAPDQVLMNNYEQGDVFAELHHENRRKWRKEENTRVKCKAGMATVAAIYGLNDSRKRTVEVTIPLVRKTRTAKALPELTPDDCSSEWNSVLDNAARLQIPDHDMQFLYDGAVRSLILHSNRDVYPGPYTYKRFWFRDAAFILNALICTGLTDRVKQVIQRFPERQTPLGYFLSQEGEWDANGEALWLLHRYYQSTGEQPADVIMKAIVKGAKWIVNKRNTKDQDTRHAGLFPPGFSAEHFGPNDYYYWDDFWGVAGLRAAADMITDSGKEKEKATFEQEAGVFMEAIEKSLQQMSEQLQTHAIPASPYRRLDVGSVGALVAGYPLRLFEPDDIRIKQTLDYLYYHCLIDGALFHDLVHSGINIYLTLHMAQCFLRAGDNRFFGLMKAVTDIASPTGQWPEAVHPKTHGGCMGDGQHIWAASEWVMMIRNLFVREEKDSLVLCSGIPAEWYLEGKEMSFGPTLTAFGRITVHIEYKQDIRISWVVEEPERCPEIIVVTPSGQKKACGREARELRMDRDAI